MALQVSLTLNKTYFLPGEVVQVSVQICNDADNSSRDVVQGVQQVIHIKELSFQAYGSERTDPSFIHRLHRPEMAVDVSDSRKQVRSIFSTEPAVLVSEQVLAPRAMQHFQLRFRLPATLPPSFRGSAARFLYLIQVKAVYELHRGELEAVVYETTASTSLMVWPSTGLALASGVGAGPGVGPAGDRRTSSLDMANSGGAAFGTAAAAAAATATTAASTGQHRELSRSSTAGGGAGLGDSHRRLSSAGGAVPTSPSAAHTPTHSSSSLTSPLVGAGHGTSGHVQGPAGGGDDGDVGLIDYALGRNNCRIRWQEIRDGSMGPRGNTSRLRPDGSTSSGTALGGGPAPSTVSFGSAATAAPQLRGVIPFGVNRPFSPPHPHHSAAQPLVMPYTDSDAEDGMGSDGAGDGRGASASAAAQAGSGHQQAGSGGNNAVQRQLSSGPGGMGPFGRQPSRRGSLFGKVYALNVGDQPLLRLLLQAPLEVPLQPGATFGGVLDFRPPSQPQYQATPQAGAGGVTPARPSVACHDVVVLLESEEVVSGECRPGPQSKRDGSGLPGGVPYVIRRLHAEAHELSADTALTSFTFSLPATATPSFRTPMVALRWVLRFELTVGPRINFAALDKRARSPRPAFEQLVWSLPLVVRPPVAGWGR